MLLNPDYRIRISKYRITEKEFRNFFFDFELPKLRTSKVYYLVFTHNFLIILSIKFSINLVVFIFFAKNHDLRYIMTIKNLEN